MRHFIFVSAIIAASTYAVKIDTMEPAEFEYEDDYEFPEVDAEGNAIEYDDEYDEFADIDGEGEGEGQNKQFFGKVGRGLASMGNSMKNGIVNGAKAIDAGLDRALVGTQNGLKRAAGAASRGLAGAAGAVGSYA